MVTYTISSVIICYVNFYVNECTDQWICSNNCFDLMNDEGRFVLLSQLRYIF
jgi:hypothetical protein